MLFNLREIKEAVDWATGDDGFRSNEVIEILKLTRKENKNATTKSYKQTKSRNDNKRPVKGNRYGRRLRTNSYKSRSKAKRQL